MDYELPWNWNDRVMTLLNNPHPDPEPRGSVLYYDQSNAVRDQLSGYNSSRVTNDSWLAPRSSGFTKRLYDSLVNTHLGMAKPGLFDEDTKPAPSEEAVGYAADVVQKNLFATVTKLTALIVPGEDSDPDLIAFNDGLRAAIAAISE